MSRKALEHENEEAGDRRGRNEVPRNVLEHVRAQSGRKNHQKTEKNLTWGG